MSELITHPANVEWLRRNLDADRHRDDQQAFASPSISGMAVYTDDKLPIFASRWEFPQERFVEYEEKDEQWCRYFGFGHDVQTTERLFYIMDGSRQYSIHMPFTPPPPIFFEVAPPRRQRPIWSYGS